MNNYHIYEEIGRGKYSVVYKGRKKKTIEYVAVKSMDKSRRKKVLNEVKIFHNLNNPNILRFYNWYETRNHLWIIFEYCSGGDLMQMIEQDKALPENVVKCFAKDLVQGLQYLHSHGIIYCDLKPSNVLLNEFGELKLCDFGLARKIVDMIQAESGSESNPGSKKGTPCYMAPELFPDDGVHSFQSDIWSLGCIIYELAVGEPPFQSSNFDELVNLILNAETPKVENFTPQFNDLLASLLQKDPLKRITWEKLRSHPYWAPYTIPNLSISAQPHFENWMKSKGLTYPSPADQEPEKIMALDKNKEKAPVNTKNSDIAIVGNRASEPKKEINMMRLSYNVKKNLLKEKNELGYEIAKDEEKSVKIAKDQEIDLGDSREEEEDDESEHPNEENISTEETENTTMNMYSEGIKFEKTVKKDQLNAVNRNIKQDSETDLQKTGKKSAAPIDKDKIGMASNFGAQGPSSTPTQNNIKTKLQPLDQLITHNSDTNVKPIMGNREIEKNTETTYIKENNGLTYYTLEEVVNGIDGPEIENHFADIYTNLSNSPNDKSNVLNYFETIIQNSNVANRLINSAFMSLLLKLLKQSKNFLSKVRICSIIGMLIRYATVIENELSQLGIPAALIDCLKDKNEKVRRKAIAALGEYLFYGATQMDEDGSENSVWDMQQSCYTTLLKILRSQEDEIVKFYTAKTVENISAQSISTGHKLANGELLLAVIQLYSSSKGDALKSCAASTLSHFARLNPPLVPTIIEKLTVKHILSIFHDGNSKVQQAFLTILLIFLGLKSPKLNILTDEGTFFSVLVSLLENSSQVIRGKCLVALVLLININFKFLQPLGDTKLFVHLDKLMRDNYKYVSVCLQHIVQTIEDVIPNMLIVLEEEVSKLSKESEDMMKYNWEPGVTDENGDFSAMKSTLKGNLSLFNVLIQILNSQLLKTKVVNTSTLTTLFRFIDYCDMCKTNKMDDLKPHLFMIYECIMSTQKILVTNIDIFLKSILTNLFSKLSSQYADIRFNCLKIFSDILMQFLADDNVYEAGSPKPTTKMINEIVGKQVLPNISVIFNDQDPMPLYGLKLLSILVEKNIQFITMLKNLKNLSLIMDLYNSSNPRLTSNTLKLILKVVECKDVSTEELEAYGFLAKTMDILKHFFSNQQDWCYEELLEIALAYSLRVLDSLPVTKSQIINPEFASHPSFLESASNYFLVKFEAIFEVFDILLALFNYPEMMIADRSGSFILVLLFIYGNTKYNELFTKPEYINILVSNIINPNKKYLNKKCLKLLQWTSSIPDYKFKCPTDKKDALIFAIDKLKSAEDKSLALSAKELMKIL